MEYSSVCHTEDRGFKSRRSCVLNEVPPRGENGSVLLKNTECLLGDFNKKSRHKNNNFIQEFDSQRDAARYLIEQGHQGAITSIATNIGRVLKGTRKTAEDFIWKTDKI